MNPAKELNTIEPQALQVAAGPESIMAVIARSAADPSVDVDKLERLMAMYERLTAKNAETAFNVAMSAAQTEIRPVHADARNKQTGSDYATYAALDKAVRPVYTTHGFALSFDTGESAQDMVNVKCYVTHKEGHSRTYHIDMPADGKGAKGGDVMTKTHATGAGVQYGKRYLLKMIFNMAVGDDDDDGNGASPKINAEQVANIEALMTEVGADLIKFLKFFKVGMVEDLAAAKYKDAISMLEAKRKQK